MGFSFSRFYLGGSRITDKEEARDMDTQTFEKRLENNVERYFFHHPLEAFLFSLIIPPIGMLLAVAIFTTLLVFPIGLLLGWLWFLWFLNSKQVLLTPFSYFECYTVTVKRWVENVRYYDACSTGWCCRPGMASAVLVRSSDCRGGLTKEDSKWMNSISWDCALQQLPWHCLLDSCWSATWWSTSAQPIAIREERVRLWLFYWFWH